MPNRSNHARGKAEEILSRIVNARNIHTPNQAQLKNEIINDLKNILDENIQKRIKEVSVTFPYLLIIGNDEEALLAACYAYCDRDIDLDDKIENTDLILADCFGGFLHVFKIEDVVKEQAEAQIDVWIDSFRSGRTVFLRSLEIKKSSVKIEEAFVHFTRKIKACKIRKPKDPGLFIISTDSLNKLPGYLSEQFEPILLDNWETTLPQGSPREEAKDKYVFREEDEFYFIKYEDEEFRLKTTAGLKYIQHLLKNPYPKQFIPKYLFQEVNKVPKLPDEDEQEVIEECFLKGSLTMEAHGEYADIVDDETKKEMDRYKDKIEIAKKTGDKGKAEASESELREFQKEYIEKKYIVGKHKKSRKFPSSLHKKPYDTINQAMKTVYEKIEKHSKDKGYDSMLTWKHLTNSINFKESYFFYRPETPPNWQF
jgi:hypothetical protein